MNKEELVRAIAERGNTKATLIQIDQILKDAFELISETLGKNEPVHIAGFGSFALSKSAIKPLGKYVGSPAKKAAKKRAVKK